MTPKELREQHIALVREARAKYEEANQQEDPERAAELDAEGDRLFALAETKRERADKVAKTEALTAEQEEREEAAASRTMRTRNEADDLSELEMRERVQLRNRFIRHGRESLTDSEHRLLMVRQGAHERAFERYMRGGHLALTQGDLDAMNKRAFQTGGSDKNTAGTSGAGNTIPEGWYATIIRNMAVWGPMAGPGFTRFIQTASGNDMPAPVEYGRAARKATQMTGGTSGTGEGVQIPDKNLNFGRVVMKAYKYGEESTLSYEVLQDTDVDLMGYITETFAESFGRGLNESFTRNTSATTGPTGLFNVLLAPTARRDADSNVAADTQRNQLTTGTTVTLDDVFNTIAKLEPAYRTGAVIQAHDRIFWEMRKFKATNSGYLWQPSPQAGQPGVFAGYPMYINQALDNGDAAGENCLVFMDPMSFFVRFVGGMRMKRGDEVKMSTDEILVTAVQRVDAAPIRPAGIVIMQSK